MGNSSGKGGPDFSELAAETRLDHAEMKELMKAFRAIANKDGYVTKAEFKAAIERSLGTSDPSFTAMLYQMFDRDGSKEIDAREFILAFAYLSNKSLDDVVETSFRMLDLNGDGHVSKGEMRSVCQINARMNKYINVHKRGVALDKIVLTPLEMSEVNAKADATFAKLDVNGDGEVSKEEFIKIANTDEVVKKELSSLLLKEEGLKLVASPGPSKKK